MSEVKLETTSQSEKMKQYYMFHSKIYDATRWTFLFDRKELCKKLPYDRSDSFKLLEVGCGTGYIIYQLHELYPEALLFGLDISSEMLKLAENKNKKAGYKVKFLEQIYGDKSLGEQNFDVILFSYSLSMINPQWDRLLDQAYEDLRPGGILAVVDFHDSKISSFKKWMGINHVRMDGHLLNWLENRFDNPTIEVKNAYMGLWQYFTFIGEK